MNNKRSVFRGFGVYLILVLAVIAIWYWLDGNNVTMTFGDAKGPGDLRVNNAGTDEGQLVSKGTTVDESSERKRSRYETRE